VVVVRAGKDDDGNDGTALTHPLQPPSIWISTLSISGLASSSAHIRST
jgi:hypothetical protein